MHYLNLEDSLFHKNLGAHWKCLFEVIPMSTHKKVSLIVLELFLSLRWNTIV